MKNKNLLLAGGLIALAVIIYMRSNKKQFAVTVTKIAATTPEMSNSCGACSGADGENWN
jgi:hypothetical protein